MADIAHLYPPNPPAVPPDLTAPTPAYRFRVVIVLLCLVVFVAVYLALTAGSLYLSYYCFREAFTNNPKPAPAPVPLEKRAKGGTPTYQQTPQPPRNEKPVFWLVVGGIFSGFLFLFMVKGLLKRSRFDPGVRVEVTEQQQPALFAFIRQLCQDTGAPFPHRVFVVPDVNAAVSFHESLVNLIFPSRKNLIIGLGLVNRLNLSEFKAVLAHEFGHFSQNSMKLGSYVYTANRVVADVVYGRDSLDSFLSAMQRTDIRIAVFAWGFGAVLWVMRKGLELLFRGINFAHVSLSRQMEYNADLVAASVTGSDALVFALARLDFAGESLSQAWNDLTAAGDHHRFTRDLYYHQTKAAEFLRAKRNDPTLGEVPALPDDPARTVQVFKPDDLSVPQMWATHPSNHDREVSVKRRYFRGPIDTRSAWDLFDDAAAVREAVTRKVYESARKVSPEVLEPPEDVQAFIDAEHAETTYDARYHGCYENRYLKPGNLDELRMYSARTEFNDPAVLAAAHARLTGDELKERMDAHKARGEDMGRLARLTHGAAELTGKDFEHRGRRYRQADAGRLLKEVETEVDRDFEWLHARDREVFRVHYAMAIQLGDPEPAKLEEWYRFHLAVQELHATVAAHFRHVQNVLGGLSGRRELSQAEFQGALTALREAHHTLRGQLDAARTLYLPPLRNMTAGDPLGPFLLADPLIPSLHPETNSLDGAWINPFMNQMSEVIDKAARVLFKSLGGLLALQQGIAERWAAKQAAGGEPPPTPEGDESGRAAVSASPDT